MKEPMMELGYCIDCKHQNSDRCETCYMEGFYEDAYATEYEIE
jgi:hypothetical protein